MKVAIISAMIEEIQPIIDQFELSIIDNINNQDIYYYQHQDLEVYIFNSGIGKTNATITTTLSITKYNFDFIINIGTSGGINKNVMINDVVIANKLAYWDVDATAFNYEIGQVPQENKYEIIDNTEFLKWIAPLNFKYHKGLVLTGDSFIDANSFKRIEIEAFDDPLCVEMESMAIVYTAHRLNTKIYVLRTISDNAYYDSNVEFNTYLNEVCVKYQNLFQHLIDNYEQLK